MAGEHAQLLIAVSTEFPAKRLADLVAKIAPCSVTATGRDAEAIR
jgi:hypothetical protein